MDSICAPSGEQQAIIDAIINKKHVIVDAVAGAGKTTLVLQLAQRTSAKILQLTYNAALKHEVRKKAEANGLSNLIVHSYASLSFNYYGKKYEDIDIENIISTNAHIKNTIKPAIIVIDEAQDMNLLYYQLLRKFIVDCEISPQFVIMGDARQCIYDFKGKNADVRYLTHADQIWRIECVRLPLNISYRLTKQIAAFVTAITHKHIETIKEGPLVQYIHGYYAYIQELAICSEKFTFYKIYCIIKDLLKTYKPDDIYVLMPSVRNSELNTYLYVETLLTRDNILCYVPLGDFADASAAEFEIGKLVFTTMHRTKGCERKIVILTYFDSSYFAYYNKSADPTICPNIHYVAATRCSERLIVVHAQGENNTCLRYLNPHKLPCEIIDDIGAIKLGMPSKPEPIIHKYSVTDFIKYLPSKLLANISIATKHSPKLKHITHDVKLNVEHGSEPILDLIGIALPAIYEHKKTNTCAIVKYLMECGSYDETKPMIEQAIKYQCIQTCTNFRSCQITDLSWFSDNLIDESMQLMQLLDPQPEKFEVECHITIDYYLEHIKHEVHIKGRIDALGADTLYEFKFKDTLDMIDILQLLVYAFIHKSQNYVLYNIKTGEKIILIYNSEVASDIINEIIRHKIEDKQIISNEQFVRNNLEFAVKKRDIFEIYTIEQLKQKCKDAGLKKYSKLNKSDLIELLKSTQ